jgi:tRNA 2-thiouridine synthesizing protein A
VTIRKLDLTGLKCPLPTLLTRKALAPMPAGDRLQVHCTDPLAAIDIPALVQQTGNSVEIIKQDDGSIVFMIEKKTDPAAAQQS